MGKAARRKALKAQTAFAVEITYIDGALHGSGFASIDHAMRMVDAIGSEIAEGEAGGIALVEVIDWRSKAVVWTSKKDVEHGK